MTPGTTFVLVLALGIQALLFAWLRSGRPGPRRLPDGHRLVHVMYPAETQERLEAIMRYRQLPSEVEAIQAALRFYDMVVEYDEAGCSFFMVPAGQRAGLATHVDLGPKGDTTHYPRPGGA